MLRIYDVGGKLLNGIKSMNVNNLPYVGIKELKRKCFMINSGVKRGCIRPPWIFNIEMKEEMGKMGERGDSLVSCM